MHIRGGVELVLLRSRDEGPNIYSCFILAVAVHIRVVSLKVAIEVGAACHSECN